MREILFRGKRVDNGEWVEGYYVCTNTYIGSSKLGTVHIITTGKQTISGAYGEHISEEIYTVIPETVGQYTGLADKNGKKIFEGDIIRYVDNLDRELYEESLERPEDYEGCYLDNLWNVSEVVYNIEFSYPAFDLQKHDFDSNALSELCESGFYYYEVIGNIHDNPEFFGG